MATGRLIDSAVWQNAGAPTAGAGVQAPVGTVLYDYANAVYYVKYGTAATAWQSITGTNSLPKRTIYESNAVGGAVLIATHTLQPQTNRVHIIAIGPGLGGGSGACSLGLANYSGGAGGCAGSFVTRFLTPVTRTFQVYLNPVVAGGAAVSNAAGANGNAGGVLSVQTLVLHNSISLLAIAGPGAAAGGNTGAAAASAGAAADFTGGVGGSGVSGGAGANGVLVASCASSGGGAGGGLTLGTTAYAGGFGGYTSGAANEPTLRGQQGAIGANGTSGTFVPYDGGQCGAGGGGSALTGVAGNGAHGVLWGAGGGGGGSVIYVDGDSLSGAGGNGGPGCVIFTEF